MRRTAVVLACLSTLIAGALVPAGAADRLPVSYNFLVGAVAGDPLPQLASVFGFSADEVPVCAACGQMAPGSSYLRRIRAGGAKVPGVRYTNIMTRYDELVVPYTSGREPGMRNIVVQDHCALDLSEHFEIAADPVASVIVLNTLDRRRKQKVPCLPVLPLVGPVG